MSTNHWIALCVNGDNMSYFYSFGLEYIPVYFPKKI